MSRVRDEGRPIFDNGGNCMGMGNGVTLADSVDTACESNTGNCAWIGDIETPRRIPLGGKSLPGIHT